MFVFVRSSEESVRFGVALLKRVLRCCVFV